MRYATLLAAGLLALGLGTMPAAAEEHAPSPPRMTWSFAGIFGRFDEAQLQRGFKVFKEVCSSCHTMKLVRFRNLAEEGGPGFSAGQVKALAETYQVKELNDKGEMVERPGRPADAFPSIYDNDRAAAAQHNGKAPPDFSVLA